MIHALAKPQDRDMMAPKDTSHTFPRGKTIEQEAQGIAQEKAHPENMEGQSEFA
jgi:hypothetical protein